MNSIAEKRLANVLQAAGYPIMEVVAILVAVSGVAEGQHHGVIVERMGQMGLETLAKYARQAEVAR